MRRDRQFLNVEIRLIEPVEQHQSIGTGSVEFLGDVTECREKWREFHRNRDLQRPFEFVHDLA